MTNTRQQYRAYAAATQTVAPTRQIVMLYDGVIRFIQQAKDAIREKRIEDRYNLLMKASEVIVGLQACLDFENGGDVAKVLYNFYSSIDNRMFTIHRTNSLEQCDELIAELKQMREVWNEIDQGNAAAETAATAPVAAAESSQPAAPDQNMSLSA